MIFIRAYWRAIWSICAFANGWPGFHKLNELRQHFYKVKSELHVENGLLLLNHRLVISSGMQRKVAI